MTTKPLDLSRPVWLREDIEKPVAERLTVEITQTDAAGPYPIRGEVFDADRGIRHDIACGWTRSGYYRKAINKGNPFDLVNDPDDFTAPDLDQPVQTACGWPARIVCWDRVDPLGLTVVALVQRPNCDYEGDVFYDASGEHPTDPSLNLVNVPRECWVNLWADEENGVTSDGHTYSTEAEARAARSPGCIGTVKLERAP